MKQVRAVIIGTGGIANAHIAALREMGERVQIVAAMDVDRARVEEFCKKYEIPKVYTDVDNMLEVEKPDLTHICTPPALHCELSVKCLEAGAWVLCEKPLCASLAEMDRIEEAERRTGRYCSSVFQWRFGSGGQHLKSLIEANEMGRFLVGVCHTTWYRTEAYYQVPWRGKWATELGGATMGHGIHAMDFFLWLVGEWEEVRSMMGTLDRPIEVEDVSMAIVRFEGGAMGSIVNSVLSPRQESYMRLDFQKATVELTHLYRYTNQDWSYSIPESASHQNLLERWRSIPPEIPSSHGSQLTALLGSMERNERPLTSGKQARRAIEFITSLYKSAITGRPVRRGSIAKSDPFYSRTYGASPPKM
jgi:predicted dehydrogenase